MTRPLFWRCEYQQLFNQQAFLFGVSLSGRPIENVCLDREDESLSSLILASATSESVAVPGPATFGGVWIDHHTDSHRDEVRQLLHHFLAWTGNRTVEISLPPSYFFPEVFEFQPSLMLELGGRQTYTDVSYHIDLLEWSTASMSKGNRKKLRQCHERSLTFSELSVDVLAQAYDLIRVNREGLGVFPSISLDRLRQSFLALPQHYHCFGVFSGPTLIATAITVLLTSDVRYVYMWADRASYRTLSPVVALCEGLVHFSRDAGVRVLDLGTASKLGVVNEGLTRFKENLGATQTSRDTIRFG